MNGLVGDLDAIASGDELSDEADEANQQPLLLSHPTVAPSLGLGDPSGPRIQIIGMHGVATW
jgi:hypothetical protein